MRKKDLLDALGKIDDKYIIEVQEYAAKTENSDDDEKENTENIVMGVEVINKTNIWRKIAPTVSIAAAFVLVVGTVAYMGKGNKFREAVSPNSAILIQSIGEQNSAEAILDKNYENLTFAEDFIVEFPEIDSFATFTMTSKPSLSGQEVYDLFDSAVEKYFPDTFTEEEKIDLYQATGKNANGETISGSFEQYKGEFLKDDLAPFDSAPFMFMNSEKGMLQMSDNGGIMSMTGTAAFNLDNSEHGRVEMYCAADNNTVIERIHIPQSGFESDMEYNLLDGSVKLTDAIAYTEDILTNDFNEEIANPLLIPDVYDAWVVDMGDGIYGYHFTMTYTYSGIRFDAQPMIEAGDSFPVRVEDNKVYDNLSGYAFTIENEKLDSIMNVGSNLAYYIDTKYYIIHESMITAQQAADILSQSVSESSGLVIDRAEFMYTPYSKSYSNGSVLTIDAAWKFTGNNTNDGCHYLFYVNAVTGEFDYYKYS